MRTMKQEDYGMGLYSTMSILYTQMPMKVTDCDAKKKEKKDNVPTKGYVLKIF